MSYSQLILRDSAEIVWPLDDITESSSISKPINFFNTNQYAFSASINISSTDLSKTPIVFGGGTLLSFTASTVGLSIPALGRFSEIYNNKDSTISFWFQGSSIYSGEQPIFKKRGSNNIGLFIKNNYLVFRYGNSASFNQVFADFSEINDPHHIVVSKSRAGLKIILDGVVYTNLDGELVNLQKDNSHSQNDYIDFYGPIESSWAIDSPAFYPNVLTEGIAKRHYVYGLGKNIPDKIFYSRGGNLYNTSTIYTERVLDINWDYPDEWDLANSVDLNKDNFGISCSKFNDPIIYSFDGNIDSSVNKYKFSSSVSKTVASYIDIDKVSTKLNSGEHPFLVKFKLDGELPDKYLSQRLISIGRIADEEIMVFDLYNNDNNYQVRVTTPNFSSSVVFDINNISSSPSFYLGMKYDGETKLFFCQSGSSIQTSTFNYLSSSYQGLDPLVGSVPFNPQSIIRIASSLNYDENSFTNEVYSVSQFTGSFERFLITQINFSASSNFNDIENYNKSKYEFAYDSLLKRFKVRTYGSGDFNIHSSRFAEYIDDENHRIGANFIGVGYPNTESSSVYFYTTLMSYSGSVVYPKTRLGQKNYLEFLNNVDLTDKYLKFEFEIHSDDSNYYPERIKYFKLQTFKSSNNSVILKDDAGPTYKIYSPSNLIYLPEIRYTPSIFMTENSGVRVKNSVIDFTENISAQSLDPRTINGLKLWIDARFINGLNRVNPDDDARVSTWIDLSENSNHAVQNNLSIAPIFRTQSLNLLRSNQLDGGEGNNLSYITPYNLDISTSIDGAVQGQSSIKLVPSSLDSDSYIDISFNTASISVFPNQMYTVVGSIKLLKPQTSSALHSNARKIAVFNVNGGEETLSASSQSSLNTAGTYSLSAVFSTSSATTTSIIKLYNGSNLSSDVVYWDNLGLYPVNSGSYVTSWVLPLTVKDHATIKFNGSTIFMESSASVNTPNSLYIVARNFGDSIFLQSTTASILYSNSASYFISYGSAQNYSPSDNKFKLFSILNNGTSASVFINGDFIGSKNSGSLNIDKLFIGRQLKGDISAILVYEGINSTQDRERVERWLNESFPMY